MDCARYEELLFAGLDAEIEPVARERMALHEHGCAHCQRLAAIVAGNGQPIPPDETDELAATVFERTSGAAALAQLQRELPTLAEADPGTGFVPAVLAATLGRDVVASRVRRSKSPRVDLPGLWQRLARRPRLALEGSYVVTMLALLIFGLPSWSAAESPVRAFDSWWQDRTEATREFFENVGETAERGIESLWNENVSGDVEPGTTD